MATKALSRAARSLPDRYQALRHLAEGGMASVWEAHDTVLDRDVAVKLLHPALAVDPDARARFTREARAAARLSHHRNVMTVFDAGEHDEQAFIVMALYRGTVAEAMRDGALDRATALRWLADAASGLDAAHAEGVVHRDVKPANLLLDEHGDLAVGDFGIATAAWAGSITRTGLVLGTGPYLAPEQRAGHPATPASDVYALAVLAHELLTGRKPEPRVPADSPALPPAAAAVLRQGTASEPDQRPATAGELVAALVAAFADPTAPTRVRRAPRPSAARPAPRRRIPFGALAAVAGASLAAGVLAAALTSGDDGRRPATARAARPPARHVGAQRRRAAPAAAASAAPAPSAAAPGDGHALNAQGFTLLNQGRVNEAIGVLQQAVDTLAASPGDIAYAYALYNLGHALRLAGRPQEAIAVLARRLAANGSDQRGAVMSELQAAQRDAGLTGSPKGAGGLRRRGYKQDGGGGGGGGGD